MTETERATYTDYFWDGRVYLLKDVGGVLYISDDGTPRGVLMHDERGYYKPDSENRHQERDAAIHLSILGSIR